MKAVAAAWNAVGVYNKDEDPTGIVDGRSKMDDVIPDAWYSLDGLKLESKPTAKWHVYPRRAQGRD